VIVVDNRDNDSIRLYCHYILVFVYAFMSNKSKHDSIEVEETDHVQQTNKQTIIVSKV